MQQTFLGENSRPTDRQCTAIGRVAATWSVLEYLMERTLARLALAPSLLGYVLTDKLGPDNRIGAIESLIRVHGTKYGHKLIAADTLSELKSFLPTLKKMKGDRNYIVHSVWSDSGKGFASRMDISAAARSGHDASTIENERVEDWEKFAETIQKACDLLWKLSSQMPALDVALLDRLKKEEEQGRHRRDVRSTPLYRRRSYTAI